MRALQEWACRLCSRNSQTLRSGSTTTRLPLLFCCFAISQLVVPNLAPNSITVASAGIHARTRLCSGYSISQFSPSPFQLLQSSETDLAFPRNFFARLKSWSFFSVCTMSPRLPPLACLDLCWLGTPRSSLCSLSLPVAPSSSFSTRWPSRARHSAMRTSPPKVTMRSTHCCQSEDEMLSRRPALRMMPLPPLAHWNQLSSRNGFGSQSLLTSVTSEVVLADQKRSPPPGCRRGQLRSAFS
mmetsp:Transcript_42248/g.121355  ORF Transcript_42248/g.121355 Transcript_42248/m.121355 type:complete len:241 (-) Transcript_42248:620-1342(-)